jgi:hypothetical protein
VADPAHPSVIIENAPNGTSWFHVRALDSEGNWGPTATFQVNIDHTPKIANLSSPTHPEQWRWYANNDPEFIWPPGLAFLSSCPTGGNAWGMTKVGDFVYYGDDWSGLQIIDVSDPAAPVSAGSYDTPGDAWSVAVVGDYAFVADGESGLQILDVSDKAAPSLVGSYDTPGTANAVALDGERAFVADGGSGLLVLDVTDKTAPSLMGSCDTPDYARDVELAEGHAYVADCYGGLQILDVSDPASPVLADSCATSGVAMGVALAGDFAYIADYYAGLQVIDISSPSAPHIVGFCGTPYYSYSLYVAGGLAYMADDYDGVQLIDVTDPTQPSLQSAYDTPNYAHDVVVEGDYVYVADSFGGLLVLRSGADPTWAYSYSLDQSPDTEPDTVADTTDTRAAFTDVSDGTSWFHVRAVDGEGNWGPTVHYQINVDITGPLTMALSYKTTKKGAIWLRYSVADNCSSSCYVTIDITTRSGKLLQTLDIGWRQCELAYNAGVPRTFKTGSYRFVVHATDELGNTEYEAGSASFVVR